MANLLGQSDIDAPFSDCSIASLLPRTLGGSISAGAALSESDDQDFVGNLFKSTKLKNYTQLVENAKLIRNTNCSSIPNAGPEKGDNISAKRTFDGQIELQGKRARQRRPGLSSIERREFIFNFPAETTAVKASQTKISDFSKRRSSYAESNSQAGPVIDYSCLENITDPTEYFSTHKMLENAEKEVRRLKGEASPRLSQPQVRRDRQRRPGLPALEGKKYVFKFPDKFASVEASQMESSTLSNGLNTTDLINSSCSKEISQTENSHTDEPERKLARNAKTCDLDVDEDFDELERLLSKCRDLDNDESGIENIVRETLQINPIHVEKLRAFPFFVETESTYESIYSSVTNGNKMDGFSDLKGRSTVINRQGNPFFLHNRDGEKKSDGSKELSSSGKDFCDIGTKTLTGNYRGKQNDELENPKFDFKDFRVDEITKSEQETLKTKLLDAKEMTNPADNISTFKMPIPFIDIQGRLDKISTSINHILQSRTECESLMFSNNDFEDSSLSKIREAHSPSPVDAVHLDESSLDVQNACIPLLSNNKQLSFEDAVHCPVIGNLKKNKDIFGGKTSEPKGHRISLLEMEICPRSDGLICDKELASDVNFVEAGQASSSVDLSPSKRLSNSFSDKLNQPFLSTDAPEQQLQSEVCKDPNMVNEQVEVQCNVLNGSTKNQRHSEASGGSRCKKLKRKEQILNRKSLAGAGTVWETGVRRSTRIRMKPLQFWCGERLLYGRVHDSLATVIGVKKFGTPLAGKKAEMKVKSFVSEQYADLVAKAALH